MHTGKFYGIFFAILLCILTPLFLFNLINGNLKALDTEVGQKMEAAVSGAMEEVKLNDGKAFASGAQRTAALDAFYGSFAAAYAAMNENLTANQLESFIPCVVLADTDGVYVCYGKDAINFSGEESTYRITPITTYSADYGDYGVSFSLDGSAEVRKDGNLLSKGNYEALIQNLSEEDQEALPFLARKEENPDDPADVSFESERKAVIFNTIQRIAETYINESANNRERVHYAVTLAEAPSAPMILAAFTGSQIRMGNDLGIQCVVRSATLGKEPVYFLVDNMDGVLTYHESGCSLLGTDNMDVPYTKKEAAGAGALPCVECIY